MTHSFPTRRSSDLTIDSFESVKFSYFCTISELDICLTMSSLVKICSNNKCSSVATYMGWHQSSSSLIVSPLLCLIQKTILSRSEEHTSELQSLMRISYAVFCLKKKKTQHLQ